MKKIFLDKNKELEDEIELYMCSLLKAVLIFNEGVKDYVENNAQRFVERIDEVITLEKQADDYLKNLKSKLYKYNLIPDLSSNILELMDEMDDIGDISKQVLIELSIEKPKIYEDMKDDFTNMAEMSLKSAVELISGVRAFFTHIKMVEDYSNKVYFYETEGDKAEERLIRKIFDSDISLCEKMHLRYFTHKIVSVSDVAEKIALKLSVFKFKRSI